MPDFFFIFYFFSLKRVVILSCSIVCVPLAGNGSKQAALVRRVFLFLFFERTLEDDVDDDIKCAEDKDDDDDVWWAQSPKDGKKEAEKDRPLDSKFWHNSPPPALSTSLGHSAVMQRLLYLYNVRIATYCQGTVEVRRFFSFIFLPLFSPSLCMLFFFRVATENEYF